MDLINDVVRCSLSVPEFDKHLKKARGHIGLNIVEITMKTIVRKPLMIKIIKLRLRNLINKFPVIILNKIVPLLAQRRYPEKTITDADYADDVANTPNQAETLQYSSEQAAAGIGLHVNEHKTEYMCFNQTGDISTQDGNSLKLVDKFTYLGSSV